MKIAAGCFGCLAFIFFVLMWATGPILSALATSSPEFYNEFGYALAYVNYVNSGCCCLSAVLAVVFLVVGSMGKKGDELE